MKGDALVNMLKDRRILVIIIAAVVIIAAVAAYVVLKDDGGNGGSDDPSDGLTIDNERTISEDMVIEGALTIGENGKLTLTDGAEIKMLGANAKVDVKGTLDATDGSITFVKQEEDGSYTPVYENGKDEARSVTSTGQLIMTPDDFASQDFLGNITGIMYFYNGALYVNSDELVVLTTATNAAAANSDVEIFGTVKENSNITISGSEELTIMDGANVTLGTITLSGTSTDSPNVTVNGILAASISTNGGAFSIAGASNMSVGLKTTGTGQSAVTTLFVEENDNGASVGSLTVTSGSVEVGDITFNEDGNVLTVNSGAILYIRDNAEVVAGASNNGENASIVVSGNIVMDGGDIVVPSGTGAKQLINVSGTLSVLDDANVGIVSLTGIVVIGEKPTSFTTVYDNNIALTGSITLRENSYIKVYGDGTLGNNTGNNASTIVHTTLNFNGVAYMTVYALTNDVTLGTVLAAETIVNGNTEVKDASTVTNWNTVDDLTGKYLDATTNVGSTGAERVYYNTNTVSITFTVPADADLKVGGLEIKDKDVIKLVIGETYDVDLTGGTAKYGSVDVDTTFTPAKDVTAFTVSTG